MKIHLPRCAHLESRFWQSSYCQSLLAEPVPLKRVVELALAHATGAAIAAADEQHAAAGYRELRDNYIPQLSTGAGLGYSYGFPLALEGSAPACSMSTRNRLC